MALKRPKQVEPATTTPASDPFAIEHVQRRTALAGATAIVDLGDSSSWKTWRFGNRDWQTEAWRLYDIIGELHKLSGRVGDSLAQARLYVTEVDQTGEEQGEVEDETIRRLAAVPLGTGSQRDDNLRLAGVDLAVGGECWVVGEDAATRPEQAEGSWFVVTGAALTREGGVVKVRRPQVRGGAKLTLTDGKDILIRCWRPHPNDTDQADSFTRSAIVPLREIELLTKREFAELDSRLTGAGVWFLPEGIDFPRAESDPAGIAGFMAYMQRAAAASMADQGVASSMVPIMATLPDQMIEHLDKIKVINFWSDLSAEIGPMKDKAIGRVASMAEIPAEVLTGLSSGNHWTSWLISEEGIRWIRSYLGLVADALTRGFLQLALKSMGVPNPERYAFAFDTSALAAKPNRLDEAIQLHDRFLITDAEVVKSGAFDVDVMPSVEDRAAQILLKLVTAQPDLILDPAVQQLLGLPAVKSVGLPATASQNTDGMNPDDDGEDTPAGDGPPNDGNRPDPPDDSARAITAALNTRIRALSSRPAPPRNAAFEAACKLAVYRALELAGGRLSTPQERRGRWADIPRHQLHARVGPVTADKADTLMSGAWTHIPEIADDLGVNADDLAMLLHGYCTELLTRGLPHSDDLLFAALSIANRGQGLPIRPPGDPGDDASFHLPGRHDQKSHGNRVGRPGNVTTKTGVGKPAKEPAAKEPAKEPVAKKPVKQPAAKKSAAKKSEAQPAKKPAAIGSRSASFTNMFAGKLENDGSVAAQNHLKDLEKVPDNLKRRGAGFLRAVVVSEKAVPEATPVAARLRGVRPRGWPEGSSWDQVPGAYLGHERTVIAGNGEGHGHGSTSAAGHEFGHGIDDSLTKDERERAEDISNRLHDATYMKPYLSKAGNPTGWQSEVFAESVAAVTVATGNPGNPLSAVMYALGVPFSKMDSVRPIVAELVELIGDIGEPG